MDGLEKTLWIARDRDGDLWLYTDRPEHNKEDGVFFSRHGFQQVLDPSLYESVRYSNSPQRLKPSIL